MDRLKLGLGAAIVLLGAVLLMQTYRLSVLSAELEEAKAKPYWPDRPEPLGLEQASKPKFEPTVRKTIPQIFWGEFADDVHLCGTEQSTIITERKIMVTEDDRQEIQSVEWKAPKKLIISAQEKGYLDTSFSMEISDDADEITFTYTNMKRIFQRCSSRAHDVPDTSAPSAMDSESNMTMNVDAAMTTSDE